MSTLPTTSPAKAIHPLALQAPLPSLDIVTRLSPGREISTPLSVKPEAIPASISESLLTPTVFHEEWWLDAATNGRCAFAEVSSGGKIAGRLPYAMRERLGLQGIWTPPLTHFLGPGVDPGNGSAGNRFLKQLEITRELIDKLPRSS